MLHGKNSLSKTEILKLQLTTLYPHLTEFAGAFTNRKEIVPYIVLDAIIQYCIAPDNSIEKEDIQRNIEDEIFTNLGKYPIKERIELRKFLILQTGVPAAL
jgi:hypothetical protein